MSIIASQNATYTISPSDLVYLYDCKRCFVDKIRHGLKLPWNFSPHFTSADRAMRKALTASEIVDLGVGPRFRVVTQGEWVQSRPIEFPNYGIALTLKGQIDALVVTEDREVFVVDYKTTRQDDAELMKFRRQLMCYTTAIERPARPSALPTFVDGMALLIFDPATFVFRKDKKIGGLYGSTRWLELPRRDDRFAAFMDEVASTIASDDPPVPNDECGICRLRFAH